MKGAETTYHSHNNDGTHRGAGGERCYVGCHDHHQILLSHDGCLVVGWGHCGGRPTGRRGCQGRPGRLSNSRVVSSLKCFLVKVLLLAKENNRLNHTSSPNLRLEVLLHQCEGSLCIDGTQEAVD